MVDRHLVIFARAPRLGRVKRRLARGIGDLAALRFYRAQLDWTIRVLAAEPRWTLWLALTPDGALDDPVAHRAAARGIRLLPQGMGDLGQRMARVLRSLPPGPAAIVGSDIPGIAPGPVSAAFDALGRHEAVFGPAPDGGYWLIGLKRVAPVPYGFLESVRWSSAYAYADSRAGLPAGWRVARGPVLEDIDDANNYRDWMANRRFAARG